MGCGCSKGGTNKVFAANKTQTQTHLNPSSPTKGQLTTAHPPLTENEELRRGLPKKIEELRGILELGWQKEDSTLQEWCKTLGAYADDIGDALNVCIPFPPGVGHVVKVGLKLAELASRATSSRGNCCLLASKVVTRLEWLVAEENIAFLKSCKGSVQDSVTELRQALDNAYEFVQQFKEQTGFDRIFQYKSNLRDFENHQATIDSEFEHLVQKVTFDTNKGVQTLLERSYKEDERDERLWQAFEAKGGAKGLLQGSKNDLDEFAKTYMRASDGVMLTTLVERALDAAESHGYHTNIKNVDVRRWWYVHFGDWKTVPWERFVGNFHKVAMRDRSVMDSIQEHLLGNEAVRETLRQLLCVTGTTEVSMDKVDRVFNGVRSIKESFEFIVSQSEGGKDLRKCWSLSNVVKSMEEGQNCLGSKRKVIFGRDGDLEAINNLLFGKDGKLGKRVVFLRGGLGAGKSSVALAAGHAAYEAKRLPGGAFHVDLEPLTTVASYKPSKAYPCDEVEGSLAEAKTKAALEDAFISCLVKALGTKMSRVDEDTFRGLIEDLAAATGSEGQSKPMLLVMTHADASLINKDRLQDKVESVLRHMLQKLPNLKVLIATTNVAASSILKPSIDAEIIGLRQFDTHSLELKLDTRSAVQMLKHATEGVEMSDEQAHKIVARLDNTPILIFEMAMQLRETLKVEEACDQTYRNKGNEEIKRAAYAALQSLKDLHRAVILNLGMFPTWFDVESAFQVVKPAVTEVTRCHLTRTKLSDVLRDLYKALFLDRLKQDDDYEVPLVMRRGIEVDQDPESMRITACNFVALCAEKVKCITEGMFWTNAPKALQTATLWKEHVEKAVLLYPEYADTINKNCLEAYMYMLSLLPYVDVYNQPWMHVLCTDIVGETKETDNKGLCAVACILSGHFVGKDTNSQQKAIDEFNLALKLLEPSKDDRLKALAWRLLGMRERSNGNYTESIQALKNALQCIKPVATQLAADNDRTSTRKVAPKDTRIIIMEYIHVLAELAGTLDYVRDESPDNFTKGFKHIQEAVKLARNHLGDDHPILATCLTYEGFYHNAAATTAATDDVATQNYELAIASHQKAYAIREQLLGGKHPDISQSWNQLGITYTAMRDYENAKFYYDKALKSRRDMFGERHELVANTLRNYGELMAKKEDFDRSQQMFIDAVQIFKAMDNKKQGKKVIQKWKDAWGDRRQPELEALMAEYGVE